MSFSKRHDGRPQRLKIAQREFKRGKRCEFCGKKLAPSKMTVDHIIPRANVEDMYNTDNWQVLCEECHYKKTHAESLIRTGRAEEVDKYFLENMAGLLEYKELYEQGKVKNGIEVDNEDRQSEEDLKKLKKQIKNKSKNELEK